MTGSPRACCWSRTFFAETKVPRNRARAEATKLSSEAFVRGGPAQSLYMHRLSPRGRVSSPSHHQSYSLATPYYHQRLFTDRSSLRHIPDITKHLGPVRYSRPQHPPTIVVHPDDVSDNGCADRPSNTSNQTLGKEIGLLEMAPHSVLPVYVQRALAAGRTPLPTRRPAATTPAASSTAKTNSGPTRPTNRRRQPPARHNADRVLSGRILKAADRLELRPGCRACRHASPT